MDRDELYFTDEEKRALKEIARAALFEAVMHNQKITLDESKIPQKFKLHLGAFVTLKENDMLRGCIGRFEPDEPLYKVIIDMAISASRYDTRFHPVTKEELDHIEIEISVLTPRRKVNSVDDVIVEKHGIYIEYGEKNGTYLPQVAVDMGWNAKEFVRSCCVEKAGIPPEHCKDATLYVYEAIVF
ncbi:MAG TPA: AmmeMemoRadiSam system protein A [Campylobacterales bacterium]|nr:AmmeMemoRadiSam system protein A [Campylobacterales bacterium]